LSSTPHGGKYFFLSAANRGQSAHRTHTFLCAFRCERQCLTLYFCPSGHCKKLTPEYEAAAAVLSAQDPPRTIAKVDATENKGIADRMQVKGFPTLYFYK
jgi:thiol-disulfide isomerase/thioredoxin